MSETSLEFLTILIIALKFSILHLTLLFPINIGVTKIADYNTDLVLITIGMLSTECIFK